MIILCGLIVILSLANKEAARIGSAEFFAPEMVISPRNGLPPRILILFMIGFFPF